MLDHGTLDSQHVNEIEALRVEGVGLIVVNVLAFTTSQSIGQAALCLFLSVLVVGTYIVGSRGQIITAIKTRQFRGLLYGTNFNP